MLNKKLLAASIAAVFSLNASAINLTDAEDKIVIASEVMTDDADVTGLALDLDVEAGLNLPTTTEFFIRFDFDGAEVPAAATIADTALSGNGVAVANVKVEGGGQAGDSYVVFSTTTDATTSDDDLWTLDLDTTGLTIAESDGAVGFTYSLYTAGNSLSALNGGSDFVKQTVLAEAITYASGKDEAGSITKADVVATVASEFTAFDGTATYAILGTIDFVVADDVVGLDVDVDVSEAEAFELTSSVTVSGNLGFGDWFLSTSATCATSADALVVTEDGSSGSAVDADFTAALNLCVDVTSLSVTTDADYVAGTVIPRISAYTTTLDDTNIDGTLGGISYDTTSITVPYVTTFSGYNQRIYLTNNGSIESAYTISFKGEDEATITPKAAAVGVVGAGKMVAIKVADIVTIDGRSRAQATIEMEIEPDNVLATTQIVSAGGTDTILLEVTED